MKSYLDLMMVLSPPGNIKEIIEVHKQAAAKIIGAYESQHSIAHISITSLPRQKPFMIEHNLLFLENKLKTLPPIDLTIDGFDHFNHGEAFRTIYARIRSSPQTAAWFKELKKILNLKEYLVPHITIARNIPIDSFNQLWPHFKPVKLVADFRVESLTLLHREAFASFAKWGIYKELPFESKLKLEEIKPRRNLIDLRKEVTLKNQQISLF
ncbi:MAG: hypothetical protein JWP37_3175 [Mucilaginibacter sp.]|nr:hypothetical protein [Mucilaginibacter sp.]